MTAAVGGSLMPSVCTCGRGLRVRFLLESDPRYPACVECAGDAAAAGAAVERVPFPDDEPAPAGHRYAGRVVVYPDGTYALHYGVSSTTAGTGDPDTAERSADWHGFTLSEWREWPYVGAGILPGAVVASLFELDWTTA